jgi:hypothetical protein
MNECMNAGFEFFVPVFAPRSVPAIKWKGRKASTQSDPKETRSSELLNHPANSLPLRNVPETRSNTFGRGLFSAHKQDR